MGDSAGGRRRVTLPPDVVEAIREQARRDHVPDPARWSAVLATVRVMREAKADQEAA
ncbi:hypothetical protein GCM10009560_79580 [Nonomuraea longicatena]|uniref:Ribbon-helix-helix protein CopG domain-containing protein n=1 Tax=Nonomuraea longicatena TaxID=83682 RepID=A0ABN1REJ9_9ACTN